MRAAGGARQNRPEFAVGEREREVAEAETRARHVQVRVALEHRLLGALQRHPPVDLLLTQAAHRLWVARVDRCA